MDVKNCEVGRLYISSHSNEVSRPLIHIHYSIKLDNQYIHTPSLTP